MLRRILSVLLSVCITVICHADDESAADKAIAKAIKLLETERDAMKSTFDQSKIDKAIRDLEAMIQDGSGAPKESLVNFEVGAATLKKKFAGKAEFNPKNGELTLKYDFSGKGQLADFDVGPLKVALQKKMLMIEAGDDLTHIAKFNNFTVNAMISVNELNGAGIGSSNGIDMTVGGGDRDRLFLQVPMVRRESTNLPVVARRGSIPVVFTITKQKSSARWGDEILAVPAPVLAVPKDDPPHQIVFRGGSSGCGIGNLTIKGIPDAAWFKEFVGE